jgi:hypothetical protein
MRDRLSSSHRPGASPRQAEPPEPDRVEPAIRQHARQRHQQPRENLQRALATLRRIPERNDHPDVAATQRELARLQALQRDVQRPD